MEKIYNSSGVEVKMAKFVGLAPGYQCPTCGMIHCSHYHCLRCGQPLVYDEWQQENYHEIYKDLAEEIIVVDAKMGDRTNPFTGEKIPSLAEQRSEILKKYPL